MAANLAGLWAHKMAVYLVDLKVDSMDYQMVVYLVGQLVEKMVVALVQMLVAWLE